VIGGAIPLRADVPFRFADRLAAPEKLRRILFLVSHSSAGGAQEIWANLAEGMRQRGHAVTLAALYPNSRSIRATAKDLPWIYASPKRPGSPGGFLKLVKLLADLFRREAPDIVFTALPAANVLAPIAARLSGSACAVVTSHHSPAQTYNRWLDRLDGMTGSMKNVTAIVTVSNAVSRSHDGKADRYRRKLRTVHNALPPNIEDYLIRLGARHPRRQAEERIVVATGRLAPQKNYPALLRAAVHLRDVRVHIVGGGPQEDSLREYARTLNVADRVTFHGFMPREDALAILAKGDVFVQPSLFEGHSLALVEAAKLGLPLVVSNVPVQIESVTSTDGVCCGLVVDAERAIELAGQIQRLMDDDAYYADFALRSRKLALEASYDSMIAAYEALMP